MAWLIPAVAYNVGFVGFASSGHLDNRQDEGISAEPDIDSVPKYGMGSYYLYL